MKVGLHGVGMVFREEGTAVTALERVDLDVREGEFLALVGPSGCGKSTLLDLIAGVNAPTSGEILIDGEPPRGSGLERGVAFQQYALLPWRTALGNVELGLEARSVPGGEREGPARRHLELVGAGGVAERYPHELPEGMRLRVAIARSLAFGPDVLLLDEPFAGLDASTRESVREDLRRVWEKTGTTVVLVTHDVEEAVCLAGRVAVMTGGPGRIREVVAVADPRDGARLADCGRRIRGLLGGETVTR
ncbi:ABC transporter ATP-binding protein [Thermocatellispora tengchongensis]